MFLPRAIFWSLSIFAVSVAAVPSAMHGGDDSSSNLRLPQDAVDSLKKRQTYPPGYIHTYVTFGEGNEARDVPVIEGDFDSFLEGEKGVRARALNPGTNANGVCITFGISFNICAVNYCWMNADGAIYSESIILSGSDGKSNPTIVEPSNETNLKLDASLNTGFQGAFEKGHECSNSNTIIHTGHIFKGQSYAQGAIDHFQCNNCYFGGLTCPDGILNNNLIAFTSGTTTPLRCS